ncbi:hypothetical protein HHI36_018339 [Cryptolaemus montrouzieri]|uniref:Uncharacterized protein n=1 Tax=Cryptolaemus montrouzieri TaxID=559131 RepID=A0ABD2NZM8_9CUCU
MNILLQDENSVVVHSHNELLKKPVVEYPQNQENTHIAEYFQLARTPQTTVKRKSKRKSYVIVSSDHKKDLEEKEDIKQEKERRKVENRLKRAQKAKENVSKETEKNVNNKKNKNRKNTSKNVCTENKSNDLKVIAKTEYHVKTADGNFMQG